MLYLTESTGGPYAEAIRRAREARAQAFRGSFAAMAHSIAWVIRTVWAVLRKAPADLARARRRRRAIGEMERLSDHLLHDIGLTRAGIPAAVDARMKTAGRAPAPARIAAPVTAPSIGPVAETLTFLTGGGTGRWAMAGVASR